MKTSLPRTGSYTEMEHSPSANCETLALPTLRLSSLQMLFAQIHEMDPNGQQDYDEMFLSAYYVEPVEPKDYSGLMTAGLWMVIAGLVLGAAGGVGVWYCKHQEFVQSLVSAEEFERSGRGK